jgi:diadenosine tetraphosphatase ApaH/serine/threonine PP2A family protein phosphatase
MERTLVIGDVHGCLDELRDLLKAASFAQGSDRLVFVGDLMDRGPEPAACVRFARELGAECVKSNHDEKFPRFRKHEVNKAATGKKNPMHLSAAPKAQYALLSDDDIAWVVGLPRVLHIAPNMVVVHAGLEPAFSVAEQSDAVIRVRYVDDAGEMKGYSEGSLEQPANTVLWAERWKGPESVIYGHAVHSLTEPRVDRFEGGACYGIDTGCVFGGSLCAMLIIEGEEPEFVLVKAKQCYHPLHTGALNVGK